MSESNYKIYASKDWVLEQFNDQEVVTSVNGATGDVTLAASDVGALPLEDYYGPTAFEEDIVSFNSLEGLSINATSIIEPLQAGSGTASPDNVRAISGFDKVELTVAGKNLCPGFKIGAYVNSNGVYNAAYTSYRCTELIRVNDGDYLCVSNDAGAVMEAVHCYDKNKKWLGSYNLNNRIDGTAYIAINYLGTDLQWVQVERGETATEYEPYKGTTTSVDLPSTTYGGTYDWNTGKLVVDRYGGRITSSMTWELGTTSSGVVYIFSRSLKAKRNYNKMLCSHCTTSAGDKLKIEVSGSGDTGYIQFTNMEQTTVDEWNNYIDNNDIYITYELETPETYYLTPHDLKTLEGLNTVWSNCGPTKGTFNTFVAEVTEKELNDAIDNIEIGGRNLLLDSGRLVTNSSYNIAIYTLSQAPSVGEEMTIRIWGKLGEGKSGFWVYNSGGTVHLADPEDNGDGTYSATFYWRNTNGDGSVTADDSSIYIYAAEYTVTNESTITKIKLERGSKATDWTPAPEDVDAAIELASQTVKSTIVAPSSMTKYYLLSSDNSAEEIDSVSKTPNININVQAGTTSTPGIAQLILGNNSAAGTAGNSTGYITLYSDGGGSHRIYPSSSTSDSIHTLPGVGGGTLISTKNYTSIPSATTSSAGLMSAADKVKLDDDVVLKSGGTLDYDATLKLNKYGTRFMTLAGDGVYFDTSADTGGWTLVLGSVTDPKGDTTTMLGAYGNPTSGLAYTYMGGSSSDPALKMTKAGVFTFKNTVEASISGNAASASVLGITSCSGTDLNTLKGGFTRCYYGYTNMTNAPVQDIGVLEVIPYSADWTVQRFTKINGDGLGTEYIRHFYAGTTWSSWRKYVTTGTGSAWDISISGNAATATKATQDSDGNTINSTYLKLSGGTMTGAIKGADYINTDPITVQPTSTAIGWYRCATFTASNAHSPHVIFMLRRNYNSPQNEGYVFSITLGYNGEVSITQLSGAIGGHIIPKIRVDYTNSSTAYIDYYMATSNYNNIYWVSGFGDATFQTPTLVSSATGTTYEFETVQGCKSDRGFVGNLTGNASSATNVAWSGVTGKPSYYDAKAIKSITRSGTTFTYTCLDGTTGTFTQQDNNTTYSAGTGISISGTTISNSGVRSISTGSTNGTISVNTNGTAADVAVKGLGSAAYTSSTNYAPASHSHSDYLPLSGGTLTGTVSTSATVSVSGYYFRNINIEAASTSTITAGSSLATGTILIKYQ